jgi:hypothetical protein
MTESLFTSQTPSATDPGGGGTAGITTATTMVFASDGSVSGIRFYASATVTAGDTYTAELWRVTDNTTGTRIAVATALGSAITPSAWNVISFDEPVAVTTAFAYRPAIHNNHNEGRYVSTGGFFTAAGLTNGNITGIQHGASPLGSVLSNGVFADNSPANTYPSSQFGQGCYFVDVVYTAGVTIVGSLAITLPALQASFALEPQGTSAPIVSSSFSPPIVSSTYGGVL